QQVGQVEVRLVQVADASGREAQQGKGVAGNADIGGGQAGGRGAGEEVEVDVDVDNAVAGQRQLEGLAVLRLGHKDQLGPRVEVGLKVDGAGVVALQHQVLVDGAGAAGGPGVLQVVGADGEDGLLRHLLVGQRDDKGADADV